MVYFIQRKKLTGMDFNTHLVALTCNLACECRRIFGCRFSPPTKDSRKYVCVRRLPAILFESFHQSRKNTTFFQSPLALLEAKSQHFPRELGHHKSMSPHFPHHSTSYLLQSSHKVPNSPTYSPGFPPSGKPMTSALLLLLFRRILVVSQSSLLNCCRSDPHTNLSSCLPVFRT